MNVHYQPIVDIESGAPVRVEAFCRLGDGPLAAIAATEFLPLAEENGLIRELTEGVIVQVLRERKEWLKPLPVAINLSQKNLFEFDFFERVMAILEQYDTDPSLVTFELSDGIQSRLSQEESGVMRRLALRGVRFSLDGLDIDRSDFTPMRVTRLPFSEVKIDARPLATSIGGFRVLRRVMAFARESGLEVVIKSVESSTEIATLRSMGATLAQGYAFGMPMEGAAFGSWLAETIAA